MSRLLAPMAVWRVAVDRLVSTRDGFAVGKEGFANDLSALARLESAPVTGTTRPVEG